tara:strand:+ start:144 stop:671 length:528 start_codon:yes stop_codon:yes gene_type:complete
MAYNDFYRILEEGESVSPEERVASSKFVNPETRDIYPPEDNASMFPDKNAHENINALQVMNQFQSKDTSNKLLDEPMAIKALKNLFPPQWARNYPEMQQMIQEGGDEYGLYFGEQMPALLNYIMQGGEQDPVGPQGMPFSQYMDGLNRNKIIEDRLLKHVNSLTSSAKTKLKKNK